MQEWTVNTQIDWWIHTSRNEWRREGRSQHIGAWMPSCFLGQSHSEYVLRRESLRHQDHRDSRGQPYRRSFKSGVEYHLHIEDAPARSPLWLLRPRHVLKQWNQGHSSKEHRLRTPAPRVPSPHSSQAPRSIHIREHKQAPTGKEINSLNPRTVACNEEAAAISLQQAATHMFDYNRLSHSMLPSARSQGKRNENTSLEHEARTRAPW